MALILLALVTKAQHQVLPEGLATQIGRNSEVFVLGILVVAALLAGRRHPPVPAVWHVVVAVGLFAVGLFVYYGPVPLTIKTLNEPFFAGAFLWLYVRLRRPRPRAWILSLVLCLVVVVGYHTAVITVQAESIVTIILVPVALDVADRRLLEPGAPERPGLRWAMLVFLGLTPMLLDVLKRMPLTRGVWEEVLRYPSRAAEGFWGLALVQLYFVVARWLSKRSERERSLVSAGFSEPT